MRASNHVVGFDRRPNCGVIHSYAGEGQRHLDQLKIERLYRFEIQMTVPQMFVAEIAVAKTTFTTFLEQSVSRFGHRRRTGYVSVGKVAQTLDQPLASKSLWPDHVSPVPSL